MNNDINLIKCPYCGSVDKIIRVDDYFSCSYCDSYFYLGNDENKTLLYEAQGLLSRYKFDDADDIYRDLSRKAIDSNDLNLYVMAEWGRLLAYFEVVYVKSFAEGIAIPTFTKYDSRFKSIKENEHYENILESDAIDSIKRKYSKMADYLDLTYTRIGRELLKTEEYDVFICVKISTATEANPNLEGYTRDSRLADGLYNELTSNGLRVFYSEKCCQGIEYDSQILSAMSRSKMMLVIATKEEYLESAWVESEWRRWLNFIDYKSKNKNSLILFIPSYDDKFTLPKIILKKKIQYFTDSLEIKNHIIDSIRNLNNSSNNDEMLNSLLKYLKDNPEALNNLSNGVIKGQAKVVEEPKVEPTPKVVEEPKAEPIPKVVEEPKVEPTPKVVEEPKAEPIPKVVEQPKPKPKAKPKKNSKDYMKPTPEKEKIDLKVLPKLIIKPNKNPLKEIDGKNAREILDEALKARSFGNEDLFKELLEKAISFNDSSVIEEIGDIYRKGELIEADSKYAVQLYELAYSLNKRSMLCNTIAYMYFNGEGNLERDFIRGLKYYNEYAKVEELDLDYYYNKQLDYYISIIPRNKKAFQYALDGAKYGDLRCMESVGFYYEVGTGTQRNEAEAELWYKLAYELGSENKYCLDFLKKRGLI